MKSNLKYLYNSLPYCSTTWPHTVLTSPSSLGQVFLHPVIVREDGRSGPNLCSHIADSCHSWDWKRAILQMRWEPQATKAVLPEVLGHDPLAWEALAHSPFTGESGEGNNMILMTELLPQVFPHLPARHFVWISPWTPIFSLNPCTQHSNSIILRSSQRTYPWQRA